MRQHRMKEVMRKESAMQAIRWVVCVVVAVGVMAGDGGWAAAEEVPAAKTLEKIELTINYAPGAYVVTREVTMRLELAGETPTSSQIHTTMVMDMEISKADAEGNRELAVTYRKIALEQKLGDRVTTAYDSSAGVPKEKLSQVGKMFEGMLGGTITVTLDPHGRVGEIRGVGEMVAAMLQSAGLEDWDAAELRQQFGDRMVEETFGQLGLPGKPVARGDTWEVDKPLELSVIRAVRQYRQVCTLEDIRDGVAVVEVKGDLRSADDTDEENPKPSGLRVTISDMTVEGTTRIDIATGMARQSEISHKGTLTLTTGEGKNKHETKLTLHGTAKTGIERK